MKCIEKRCVISRPREEVWAVWTTSTGAETFFAPKANIELKLYGKYEILFMPQNEPGFRGAEDLKVLSFVPDEMISFEWNAPPQFPNVRRDRSFVVVTLNTLGASSTEVVLRHLGWKEGEEWDQVYAYFERAWGIVFGNLEKRFASGPLSWGEST